MNWALAVAAFASGGAIAPLLSFLGSSRRGGSDYSRAVLRESFADLLPYGIPCGPGILLNCDGSLMCGWSLRGSDYSSASLAELEAQNAVLRRALLPLVDRWIIHINALRVPVAGYAPLGAFPDPLTAAIDEERRALFERRAGLETEIALTLSYRPRSAVYRRTAQLFLENDRVGETPWTEEAATFLERLEALEGSVGRAFALKRLDTSALVSHLRSCITGEICRVAVDGSLPAELRYLLAEDVRGGTKPQVGEQHLRVVSLRDYPRTAGLGSIEPFHELPYPCRSSHRILPLSRSVAGSRIRTNRQVRWRGSQRGSGAKTEAAQRVFRSAAAEDLAVEAGRALDRLDEGEVFAQYTWKLVLSARDEDEVELRARDVIERFTRSGYVAVLESVGSLPAYLGSLPGESRHDVRRPLISLEAISALAPTSQPWLGPARCPSRLMGDVPPLCYAKTSGGTAPYRLFAHTEDVGHGLILGRIGAGKSVMLAFLALQWLRYPDSKVFYFDHELSAALAVVACGGSHYRLVEGEVGFQPLRWIDEPEEHSWAAEFIEGLLELQRYRCDSEERRLIDSALTLLALHPADERTLTRCFGYLDSEAMRGALSPYTDGHRYGALLDANSDSLVAGQRLQCFETAELLKRSEAIRVPVLRYLFHRIDREASSSRNAPLFVALDEAWLALRDAQWAEQVESWLRGMRKQNGAVQLATHDLAELQALSYSDVLFASCPNRILTPNRELQNPEVRALYRSLGLNHRELELLEHGEAKRDYLHVTGGGSRLIDLELGPLALALLTPPTGQRVSENFAHAEALIERWGPEVWLAKYLEERGIDAQALESSQLKEAAA